MKTCLSYFFLNKFKRIENFISEFTHILSDES